MSPTKLAMTLLTMLSIVAANLAYGQQLERAGLKQHWFTHSGVGANGKLADWYLDIDENSGTTFFEIAGGDYSETLSENDIGPNGKPLGIDFGLELANIKAEVVAARLKSNSGKDVEVKVNQYTLPKSTLYTQTSTGVIRSYDAETGKVRWTTNLGNARTESLGIAGKGKYVAALKGGEVFCIDSASGSVLWSKQCEQGPSAPPQVDGDQIFVPLLSGRVERFKVADKGFNSDTFIAGGSGITTTRPALSSASICWANYSGTVSIAARGSTRGMPGFQLNAAGPVLEAPQYKNGIYFVTSIDSYIYALSESRGSLIWESSTGFEISQAPILIGNYVYVINDLNQLSRYEAATGRLSADWQTPRPNIGTYAGASKTKLFTISDLGQLKVLDQETGEVTGTAPLGTVAAILPNLKTDRLYVLNNTGTIRCYREINSVRPFFHSDEFKEMKPKDMKSGEMMKDKPKSPEPDSPLGDDDPFGDPFGGNSPDDGGDDEKAAPENNDPFGAGGDDAGGDGGGDPFGGDPFGGDGDDDKAESDDPFGDPFSN